VQSKLIIRDVIRDLNEEGVAVFLTTHNIEEANSICDRVAIINKGKIAAIDSPERLKSTIQSVQSVEVAFNQNTPDMMDSLKRLAKVSEVREEGDNFRLFTEDPASVMAQLADFASIQPREQDREPEHTRPSLGRYSVRSDLNSRR
jgi:ABC-2 type transport system ATP-binding protein